MPITRISAVCAEMPPHEMDNQPDSLIHIRLMNRSSPIAVMNSVTIEKMNQTMMPSMKLAANRRQNPAYSLTAAEVIFGGTGAKVIVGPGETGHGGRAGDAVRCTSESSMDAALLLTRRLLPAHALCPSHLQ